MWATQAGGHLGGRQDAAASLMVDPITNTTSFDVVTIDYPDRDLYILRSGDFMRYRSRACEKEPETVQWIAGFEPRSVFWDVGASVGPYSLIAAAQGHIVFAFEPNYASAGEMQQNVWLNNMDKDICVIPVALANTDGFDFIQTQAPMAGVSTQQDMVERGVYKRLFLQSAQMMKADHFANAEYPNHVKIDVDGSEVDVLQGGRNIWKNIDSMMIESDARTQIEDVSVILNGCGLHFKKKWKRPGEGVTQHNYLFER